MVTTDPSGLAPNPEGGLHKDILYHHCCSNTDDATALFVEAKERLLDVDNWHRTAGCNQIRFRLYDTTGQQQQRHARQHDLILAERTEQGPRDEGSQEWMRIGALTYDDYPDEQRERMSMELRPATDPHYQEDDTEAVLNHMTACCLMIERKGSLIEACCQPCHSEHHPDMRSAVPRDRDAAPPPGTLMGMSEVHWASLVSGLIEFNL
jgi:hypothetical protein